MLASIFTFVLLAVSAAALPPRYPHSAQRSLSEPVTWVTKPESIAADTDVRLEWTGGDGYGSQVYFIPQWAEQASYHPIDIAKNTTSNSLIWHTPKKDAYPAGTTFILGVNDGSQSVSGDWYDVSGLIPFVDSVERRDEQPRARKGWVWTI